MHGTVLGRLRRSASLALLGAGFALLGLASAAPVFGQEAGRTVDVVEVKGIIDPTMETFLRQRLQGAQEEGVHAVIIQMDTPGGLDVSMRGMIQEIVGSTTPVIVWVAPRGARAASAGTFIAYAAHLAYMAEQTAIGAASPVNLGGEEADETMQRKVTNDAAEYIKELARARGRNEEWAEAAVRDAESLGASEAAEMKVVNGVTSSLRGLLETVDGERIVLGNEQTVTLDTWDQTAGTPSVTIRFQEMNLIQRLLHTITNPEIALLLITLGTLGLIFEIYNPGIGLAGILGAVCLLMGFYALSVLPTNWAGVFLIILGIVFFIVDLQVAGLGIWTVGGTASLIVGSLILFSGAASPELQVSWWAIVAIVAGTLVFFISVMTAALRVRLRKPVSGEEAIVGTVGVAKTDIAPEGTVTTKGTTWRARTMETGIAAGEKVQIMATEGLTLLVEPFHEHAPEEETTP